MLDVWFQSCYEDETLDTRGPLQCAHSVAFKTLIQLAVGLKLWVAAT